MKISLWESGLELSCDFFMEDLIFFYPPTPTYTCTSAHIYYLCCSLGIVEFIFISMIQHVPEKINHEVYLCGRQVVVLQ